MSYEFTTGEPNPGGFTLLEPGEYQFQVLDATEAQSNAGNEMIALKLDVFNDGRKASSTVWDNLVFTDKAAWKIDSFLKSCGMHPGGGQQIEIEPGEFIGWEGRCRVINELDNKGVNRNKIQGYTWTRATPHPPSPQKDEF